MIHTSTKDMGLPDGSVEYGYPVPASASCWPRIWWVFCVFCIRALSESTRLHYYFKLTRNHHYGDRLWAERHMSLCRLIWSHLNNLFFATALWKFWRFHILTTSFFCISVISFRWRCGCGDFFGIKIESDLYFSKYYKCVKDADQ